MKGAGIPLMIMVQSVEEAVQAAELGADAVVAQVRPTSECYCVKLSMQQQAAPNPFLPGFLRSARCACAEAEAGCSPHTDCAVGWLA